MRKEKEVTEERGAMLSQMFGKVLHKRERSRLFGRIEAEASLLA